MNKEKKNKANVVFCRQWICECDQNKGTSSWDEALNKETQILIIICAVNEQMNVWME